MYAIDPASPGTDQPANTHIKNGEFVSAPQKMLCQDCLRVLDYSDDGHNGLVLCECGGEYCGCADCVETINFLIAGERSASTLGTQHDIDNWTDVGGVNANG